MTWFNVLILTVCATSVCGKVFTKCELAQTLYDKGVARNSLKDWVCMAQYESAFDTTAVGINDHSKDHGIFQINDYWNCDPQDGSRTKNGCGHPCSDYKDSDLTDDVACINQLYREHGYTYGFSYAYQSHCSDVASSYLSGCTING